MVLGSGKSALNQKRLQAASMLAEGRTQREIACTLNVSERTVIRWTKTPVVQNVLTEAQRKAVHVVNDSVEAKYRKVVEQSLGLGLTTLVAILRNPDSRSSDKIRCVELLSKWYGLDAPVKHQIEIGVERELDVTLSMLQCKMSQEAFNELISVLAEQTR